MDQLGLFSSKLWGMALTPVWWHCDMKRYGRNNYILLDTKQWPSIGLTMDDDDTVRVYHLIRQKMNGNHEKSSEQNTKISCEEIKFKL